MDFLTSANITHENRETTHYYEGGPKDGIPLIFVHGCPDLAESWKHQLKHFSTEYHVIAPDMRGYGDSSAPRDKRSYSLEVIVNEMVEFANQLNIKKAVWIGHDWGSGVTCALAAHHPDLFLGLVNLTLPYRTVELGLDYMLELVNRNIYPKDKYPYGQWSYMKYFELYPEESIAGFESDVERLTKMRYMPYDPSKYGQPARTSRAMENGGWFGGRSEALPDIPLSATLLDESLYQSLLASQRKHGAFPMLAYYLNHDVNAEYAKSEKNGGLLEFPVLFVDAKHDSVGSPSTTPKMGESQRAAVKNLTYETIESEHWVYLEKPAEVNKVIEKFIDNSVRSSC